MAIPIQPSCHVDVLQRYFGAHPGLLTYIIDRNYCFRWFSLPYADFARSFLNIELTIGCNAVEVINNPTDRHHFKDVLNQVWDGETLTEEQKFTDFRGITNYFSICYSPVWLDKDTIDGVTVVMTDLTKQKNLQEAISERELRFRSLFTKSPNGIRIVDHTGTVIEENQRMEEITGYAQHDSIGRKIWDIVYRQAPVDKKTPELYDRIMEECLTTLQTGQFSFADGKRRTEYLILPDGQTKSVNASYFSVKNNNGYYLFSIVTDITENERNKKELYLAGKKIAENEEKYRLIAENTSDGILVIDSDTRILYASPAYMRQLGYTEREELARDSQEIYQIIHADDRDQLFKQIFDAISKKEKELIYTYRAKHKLGHFIWREDHAQFHYDEHGNYLNTYVICREITERKHAEQELILAKEKAEESDHLKTAILHNISHEIRTPMNAIMGFSELLSEAEPANQQRFATIVYNGSKRSLGLIDDVMLLSRLQSEKTEPREELFSPAEIIGELMNEFSSTGLKKKVTLRSSLPDSVVHIQADREKIQTILSKLISNGLKFTHEGYVEVGFKNSADELEFYVKDSGIGIPLNEQERIYDSFYRCEQVRSDTVGGAGLGLTLVRQLVTILGGSIKLDSHPGAGSCFTITLPYRLTKTDKTPVPSVRISEIDWKKLDVLIADDEEDNHLLLFLYLKDMFRSIDYAKNGQIAVDMAEKKRYGLILMDLRMPVMDGITAIGIIHGKYPEIPIITQTAYLKTEEINTAVKAGCLAILPKPITKSKLKQVLNKHLGSVS
jgi:PAS domain S-box-containing protein